MQPFSLTIIIPMKTHTHTENNFTLLTELLKTTTEKSIPEYGINLHILV